MIQKQIIKEISKQYPQAWQQVKLFRASKGKELPDWPDWCYIPIAAGIAIATQGDTERLKYSMASKISPAVITAAAAWRVTQGVYRFDADLYNALVTQPLDGNLPCDALKRLPEWCVYIETINANFKGILIDGFWAHLEKNMNDGREELRLVLVGNDEQYIPIPIHLGDWTLEEGIHRMQDEADKQAGQSLTRINFVDDLIPLVQLVLYLCAENVDMPRMPQHPTNRVRQSGQVDIAREPKTWDVGVRIGASIRKYRNEESQREGRAHESHESPRPHVRRAHWHHFWTGPRKGERKLVLRWLPPIPVGVDEEGQGPVVIHKIKEEKEK